ncbi:hypothetical protein KY331_02345 [Candidatus Woesearchaeota archaeon]|nr:hypothetical protein [Candidatus Woesearchaeota archaeon]
MALFGKKKEEAPGVPPGGAPMPPPQPAGPPQGVPTAIVIQMRKQGLTNNQIVQTLQREGYSSSQIFDAMSQADIKGIVEKPGEGTAVEPGPAPAMPPPMPEGPAMPPTGAPPPMPPTTPGAPPSGAPSASKEEMEEVAESIIDEKWEELMKAVDKIVAWKETTDAKITKIEQKMDDLKSEFDALHKGILGKIEEYDKGIKGVGTDIKAMEEVFKKTLPTFTENIHELSRVTKQIKGKKKKTV